MRLFNSFLVALTALLVAGSASATVRIDNSSTTPNGTVLALGETIAVQVRLNWNGTGALQGVFASTTWDASVFELVSNTTRPASILSFVEVDEEGNTNVIPGLNSLGGNNQPGDPTNILRSVQYGGTAPVDARAATTGTGRLIMTITLRAIGGSPNTSVITTLANGDSGATGDDFVIGNSVSVSVIPEPGTALLMGLGLMGLGLAGRRD